jgi:hypothetical protein
MHTLKTIASSSWILFLLNYAILGIEDAFARKVDKDKVANALFIFRIFVY